MRLAAVGSRSVIGDVRNNLRTTMSWIEELSDRGADLILFPEMNVSGYTRDVDVINGLLEEKDSVFRELEDVSRGNDPAFAVGFPEREGGCVYISHHLFHGGKVVGVHRKTHLGPTEREVFSEGERIDVFRVGEMRIGLQLCFETHFPEISYIQARQGANVLAMGFASPKEDAGTKLERFKRHLTARAYDNSCFVIACNQESVNERGTAFPGLSLAIDPKGMVLGEDAHPGREHVLAECDLERIASIKRSSMAWFNRHKRDDLLRRYYG